MKAKRKVTLTILLASATFLLINCSPKQSSDNFDSTPFRQSKGAVTLCFDLRDDTDPKAGLLLKIIPKPESESHTLALPFGSTSISARKEIYSTSGSYDSMTLIRFYSLANTAGSYEISMSPNFGKGPAQWNDDVRDLPTSTLYFLEYGLVRHFIYKYPDADPNKKQWLEEISKINNTNIDSVAVVLPTDSTGREIKRTNKTAMPEPEVIEDTKFFPATSTAVNKTTEAIYVKYEVPPNNPQQFYIEQGAKSAVSIIPIFVQLLIYLFGNPESKRWAKFLLWIFVFIQLLFIIWLIYSAVSFWNESAIKSILDLIIAIITGTVSGLIVYKEKKRENAS